VLRVGPDTTVPTLKLAYRRALLAIAADDLTGRRDIEDVMALLSCLADDTLRAALAITARELTADPAGLAVVAMGKCGGGELNYVSDVDVIFVARDDADLARAAALASRMMAICGQVAWPGDAA